MQTQEEIWKDIPGYEGFYQASNLGRIKSLTRVVNSSYAKTRTLNGRILVGGFNKGGYRNVSLSVRNVVFKKDVHVLIAITFLNHIPNKKIIVVDHKNNIKTDNRSDNLMLTSQRSNSSRGKTSNTGITGVHKRKGKFESAILINKKSFWIGRFFSAELASKAYKTALKNVDMYKNNIQFRNLINKEISIYERMKE